MRIHYMRAILDFLTFFSIVVILYMWGLNGDFSKKEKKIGSIVMLMIIIALRVVRKLFF
ncbi:hypothetical protein SAMN02910358_01006 [Lachnospiraceae bacterium XBB1006]|nr:hypothetical protein SAMN02910358_01006 [Lachnospiraceae bacterium XBB1006]